VKCRQTRDQRKEGSAAAACHSGFCNHLYYYSILPSPKKGLKSLMYTLHHAAAATAASSEAAAANMLYNGEMSESVLSGFCSSLALLLLSFKDDP